MNIITVQVEYVKQHVQVRAEGRTNMAIASAVYGSYDCPQVWTLRRYRDKMLSKTWYGRLFIFIYYSVSPMLVKLIGDKHWFKKICKLRLDRFVRKLKEEGVPDTPYQDT